MPIAVPASDGGLLNATAEDPHPSSPARPPHHSPQDEGRVAADGKEKTAKAPSPPREF